ncbi:MAG: ParB N-terminal domain-containing protein [Acidimicrobiia bacterium]|nr:ParB N-terminal domain-containing protein [Acidimicrobiia bacterium]
MPDQLELKDPIKRQPMTVKVAAKGDLEVIGHQRKPRPAHLKALTASMERMGFITPLVAVERDGKLVIIDGQHRFSAAVELGVKEFPVVVVPEKLARRMMSLNIEQSLNIRERSTIALAIYREMLEESPTRSEDHGEVADAIETAHLLTLGLAYEGDGRLAGSAFESILKKCDGFLDKPLSEAYELREEGAAKVLDAAKAVKRVEEALKAKGAWHSMARYQIISSANPTKRARKPSDFDKTFDKFIASLEQLAESPEKVLGEKVDD